MNNSNFQSQWGYPSEIKPNSVRPIMSCAPSPTTSEADDPTWNVSSSRLPQAREPSYGYVSKKTGKPYRVCARNEPAPQRTILKHEQSSDADALDVLNSIYAEA